uniref:Mitogen-activated protein kinase 20 n=1 Tax=Rhizophora mucronata TaxID=61149 RepID=A0A2P2QAG1_RHIMU
MRAASEMCSKISCIFFIATFSPV